MGAVALKLVDGAAIAGTVGDIQRHHELAQQHAQDAVEHARQAGALLLLEKARQGHGRFLTWLGENFAFTARTAQRYMSAAAPRPKATRVSHLPPRPGSKRAQMLEAGKGEMRRTEVLSHVAYVAAELPNIHRLTGTDIEMLMALRSRIDGALTDAAEKQQGIEQTRTIINDADIKAPIQKNGRKIDPNKIVRETVATLTGITQGLALAKVIDIGPDEARILRADLCVAMEALRDLSALLNGGAQ